jgi:hypothetical protein
MAGIMRETNIDLLVNSNRENDETVRRITMPATIASSA